MDDSMSICAPICAIYVRYAPGVRYTCDIPPIHGKSAKLQGLVGAPRSIWQSPVSWYLLTALHAALSSHLADLEIVIIKRSLNQVVGEKERKQMRYLKLYHSRKGRGRLERHTQNRTHTNTSCHIKRLAVRVTSAGEALQQRLEPALREHILRDYVDELVNWAVGPGPIGGELIRCWGGEAISEATASA